MDIVIALPLIILRAGDLKKSPMVYTEICIHISYVNSNNHLFPGPSNAKTLAKMKALSSNESGVVDKH